MKRTQHASSFDGVLVVDKPAGMSSFDVIRQLRRVMGRHKYGHAGTLDPMATGVLPIMLGQATRLAPYLMLGQKRYRAEVMLGVATETDDREGDVIAQGPTDHLSDDAVHAALRGFVGTQMQRPPKYSAIKIQGKRAYAEARKGRDVVLEPREVEIHAIDAVRIDLPRAQFEVTCGKGTYVRSIARDMGEALGTRGTLWSLRRLSVGPFDEVDAVSLDALAEASPVEQERWLLSPYQALADLACLEVDARLAEQLACGVTANLPAPPPGTYKVPIPGTQDLLAILVASATDKPKVKVFCPQWTRGDAA